jgi:hypothetical protein
LLPDASASTYIAMLGVILGALAVILISWRNALPTDSIGLVLQRTESHDPAARARVRDSDRR